MPCPVVERCNKVDVLAILWDQRNCHRYDKEQKPRAPNRSDVKTHIARHRPTVFIQATSHHKNTRRDAARHPLEFTQHPRIDLIPPTVSPPI